MADELTGRSTRDQDRLQDEERRMRRAAVTAATRQPPDPPRATGPSATGPTDATGPTGPTHATDADADEESEDDSRAGQRHEQQALWLDAQIRDAMARGEFDNLPGAGKPIPGLDKPYDPDWWVKRLIEREDITGVLPPALALRKEDAELETVLDREVADDGVRRVVEDFNHRVVEARRQLLGGPPVITLTRDPDAEVEAWRARREERRVARLRERGEPDRFRQAGPSRNPRAGSGASRGAARWLRRLVRRQNRD